MWHDPGAPDNYFHPTKTIAKSRIDSRSPGGRNQEFLGVQFACGQFETWGPKAAGSSYAGARTMCRKYGNSDPVGNLHPAYHYLYVLSTAYRTEDVLKANKPC